MASLVASLVVEATSALIPWTESAAQLKGNLS